MKKIFALGLLALLGLGLSACTTAGPYVTNISSNGANGLNVEKCTAKLNAFMGTVSNGACSTQSIELSRNN